MGTESFVLLLVVATAVAIAARRLRLPYTVALVCAGLVLGFLHLFEPPQLTKELLYALFLPGSCSRRHFTWNSATSGVIARQSRRSPFPA
jgi:hypothetical protein